jgi:hypothetical protein
MERVRLFTERNSRPAAKPEQARLPESLLEPLSNRRTALSKTVDTYNTGLPLERSLTLCVNRTSQVRAQSIVEHVQVQYLDNR